MLLLIHIIEKIIIKYLQKGNFMKKIVFTGGGTAGHITPNLAIIEQLKDYDIYYIGSSGMEKEIVSKYKNIKFVEIPAVKFIRSLTPKNLLLPFKLIKSINATKKILKEIQPSLIFSKGGFVSIPTCLAGNSLKIPVITHESDLTVGLANKIIAKKAKYLCCSFKETADNFKKNSIFTGSPIREKIFKGNKFNVISKHKTTTNKPIILVTGGSSGAKAINNAIWENINDLCDKYVIIHITGKNNLNSKITHKNYIQIDFTNNIEDYFAASDIVISRAGSNTIFELLAIKKPMILIPLPKDQSRGDQLLNAENFNNQGIANILYQENLNKENLLRKITETLLKRSEYINNMKKLDFTCGNDNIIKLIKKYL